MFATNSTDIIAWNISRAFRAITGDKSVLINPSNYNPEGF